MVNTTDSGKLFHTLTTLLAKKPALTLSHRYLYSLYKCPLVEATEKLTSNDFKCRLKALVSVIVRRCGGREFHAAGPNS